MVLFHISLLISRGTKNAISDWNQKRKCIIKTYYTIQGNQAIKEIRQMDIEKTNGYCEKAIRKI